jgi:hypothetical protein
VARWAASTKRFHDEALLEFKVGCDAAYVSINKFAKELTTFEKRAVHIARNQELATSRSSRSLIGTISGVQVASR